MTALVLALLALPPQDGGAEDYSGYLDNVRVQGVFAVDQGYKVFGLRVATEINDILWPEWYLAAYIVGFIVIFFRSFRHGSFWIAFMYATFYVAVSWWALWPITPQLGDPVFESQDSKAKSQELKSQFQQSMEGSGAAAGGDPEQAKGVPRLFVFMMGVSDSITAEVTRRVAQAAFPDRPMFGEASLKKRLNDARIRDGTLRSDLGKYLLYCYYPALVRWREQNGSQDRPENSPCVYFDPQIIQHAIPIKHKPTTYEEVKDLVGQTFGGGSAFPNEDDNQPLGNGQYDTGSVEDGGSVRNCTQWSQNLFRRIGDEVSRTGFHDRNVEELRKLGLKGYVVRDYACYLTDKFAADEASMAAAMADASDDWNMTNVKVFDGDSAMSKEGDAIVNDIAGFMGKWGTRLGMPAFLAVANESMAMIMPGIYGAFLMFFILLSPFAAVLTAGGVWKAALMWLRLWLSTLLWPVIWAVLHAWKLWNLNAGDLTVQEFAEMSTFDGTGIALMMLAAPALTFFAVGTLFSALRGLGGSTSLPPGADDVKGAHRFGREGRGIADVGKKAGAVVVGAGAAIVTGGATVAAGGATMAGSGMSRAAGWVRAKVDEKLDKNAGYTGDGPGPGEGRVHNFGESLSAIGALGGSRPVSGGTGPAGDSGDAGDAAGGGIGGSPGGSGGSGGGAPAPAPSGGEAAGGGTPSAPGPSSAGGGVGGGISFGKRRFRIGGDDDDLNDPRLQPSRN